MRYAPGMSEVVLSVRLTDSADVVDSRTVAPTLGAQAAFTVPMIDRLLRTDPDPSEVEHSDTVRTLGVDDA